MGGRRYKSFTDVQMFFISNLSALEITQQLNYTKLFR